MSSKLVHASTKSSIGLLERWHGPCSVQASKLAEQLHTTAAEKRSVWPLTSMVEGLLKTPMPCMCRQSLLAMCAVSELRVMLAGSKSVHLHGNLSAATAGLELQL